MGTAWSILPRDNGDKNIVFTAAMGIEHIVIFALMVRHFKKGFVYRRIWSLLKYLLKWNMLFVVSVLVLFTSLRICCQTIFFISTRGQYWSLRGWGGDGKMCHGKGVGTGRKTTMRGGNRDGFWNVGWRWGQTSVPCHSLLCAYGRSKRKADHANGHHNNLDSEINK